MTSVSQDIFWEKHLYRSASRIEPDGACFFLLETDCHVPLFSAFAAEGRNCMFVKRLKRSALLGTALVAVLSLASCDLIGNIFGGDAGDEETTNIEIAGTWWESSYGSGLIVTNDSIEFHTSSTGTLSDDTKWQKCEIVSYSNDGFNNSETGTGDCGYAVIKYTEPSSYVATAAQDKYGILRWHSLTTTSGTTTVAYEEGYLSDSSWNAVYSETAAEAITSFTTSAGAFTDTYYTTVTLQD